MLEQGAAAAILDDDGRVLLIKENYGRRRWNLPGGLLEEGETPREAVVREVREETGVEAAVDHVVGVYRLDDGFLFHVFRCRIVSGTPSRPSGDEIASVEWHRVDALPQPLGNGGHYGLRDAIAGRRGVVREGLPRID